MNNHQTATRPITDRSTYQANANQRVNRLKPQQADGQDRVHYRGYQPDDQVGVRLRVAHVRMVKSTCTRRDQTLRDQAE